MSMFRKALVQELTEEELEVLLKYYRERSRRLENLEEMLWEKIGTMPYDLGIDEMKSDLEELRKKVDGDDKSSKS